MDKVSTESPVSSTRTNRTRSEDMQYSPQVQKLRAKIQKSWQEEQNSDSGKSATNSKEILKGRAVEAMPTKATQRVFKRLLERYQG